MSIFRKAHLILVATILSACIINGQWMPTNGPYCRGVSTFAVLDSNIFAGTGSGVFRSTDNGFTWTAVNNGLTDSMVMSLAVSGTSVFAGTEKGVFRSMDNGENWVPVNNGLKDADSGLIITTLCTHGTNLLAGVVFDGVYI